MTFITIPTVAPPDSNTFLYWPLNDAVGTTNTFVQLGTAGTNSNLILSGSSAGSVDIGTYTPSVAVQQLRAGRLSPTGNGVDLVQNAQSAAVFLKTSGSTFTPSTTTTFSIHGWMNLHSLPGSGFFPRIISKWCDTGGVGSAPDAFAILLNQNSANLYVQASSTGLNNGTNTSFQPGNITNNGRDSISLQIWHHIAITFSNGTVTMYVDGFNTARGLMSNGLTAVNWGTGNWSLGGTPVSASGLDAELSDWRVDTVVRPASYFQAIYQRGVRK